MKLGQFGSYFRHSRYKPANKFETDVCGYGSILSTSFNNTLQQPVIERYLDRALQQVGRTHFTIVTCRSVPLRPPLFEHSNCPVHSFFRVLRNRTLTNLVHLRFDLVTCFPPFPFAFFGGSLKSSLSESLSHSEHQGSPKHNGFEHIVTGYAYPIQQLASSLLRNIDNITLL